MRRGDSAVLQEAGLAWVGQLQAPKVRLSCTDQVRVQLSDTNETTEMGAALQRFATDTTCNDTRQADGEPRKLLSSVDVALAIADRTDPTNSGNLVGHRAASGAFVRCSSHRWLTARGSGMLPPTVRGRRRIVLGWSDGI